MNYPKKEFCISLAVLMRLCARLAGPARRPQETAGFGAETDFLHCVQYATFSPTLGVQVGRVCSIVVGAARRTGRGGRRCNNASSEPLASPQMLGKRKGKQKRRASDGVAARPTAGSSESAGTSGKVAAEVRSTLGKLRLRKGTSTGAAAAIVPNEEKLAGWKENRYLRRSFLDEVSMRPRRSAAGKQTTKTSGAKKPATGTGPTSAEAVEALTTLLKGPVKSVNVLFVGPAADGEQSAEDEEEDEERMRTWSTVRRAPVLSVSAPALARLPTVCVSTAAAGACGGERLQQWRPR